MINLQFRNKLVVIEAQQYTEYGKLIKGMCNSQSCFASGNTEPHIHTIYVGEMINLVIGDWVIPGPDGVHYCICKPDIFESLYSEADAEPNIFIGSKKTLGQYETMVIGFEGRDETIQISGNGSVKYDLLVTGSEENIFSGRSSSGWTNGGPSKLDRISLYISLLNESQRAGADVRFELESALSSFKKEAGI